MSEILRSHGLPTLTQRAAEAEVRARIAMATDALWPILDVPKES